MDSGSPSLSACVSCGGPLSCLCKGSSPRPGASSGSQVTEVLGEVAAPRSSSLDCIRPERRIFSGVRQGSSSIQPSFSGVSLSGSGKDEHLIQGDRGSCPERSSGGSSGHHNSRVLFQNVPGTQEIRGLETNHRLKHFEHLSQVPSIQDGISRVNPFFSGQRLVDLFHRPQGRLSSRPHSSCFQEIHEDILQGESLSVSGTTIRSVPSSLAFYEDSVRGQGNDPSERDSIAPVFRRLVVQSPDGERMLRSSTSGLASGSGTWMDRESGEIRSHTEAGVQFLRHQVRPDRIHGFSDRRELGETQEETFRVASGSVLNRQPVATAHRSTGFTGETGSFWHAAHETVPLAPRSELVCSQGSSRYVGSNNREYHEGSGMVDEHRHFHVRASRSTLSSGQDLHRRLYQGLGSPRRGSGCEGFVESRGNASAHQHIGNESGSTSLAEPRPQASSQRSSLHGQHLRGVLCEQTGGDKVMVSVARDSPVIPTSAEVGHDSSSGSHTRKTQCHSGYAIQGGTSITHRMVPESVGSPSPVSGVGNSSTGSVCDKIQQQVSDVRISSSRLPGSGNGRVIDGLESSVGVCLPPSTHSVKGHQQDQNLSVSGNPDSVCLASTTIFPRSTGAVCSATVSVTRSSQSSNSTSVRSVPSSTRAITTPRLALEHRTLAARGFSEEAASRISAPQAKSSLGVYEARWRVFATWCEGRDQDPFQASAPLIADFLLHLFKDLGRKPSTIAGYRTALAGALKTSQGIDYGKDSSLTSLILSFFREQPRSIRSFPSWDLGLILKVLLKPPFEPLQLAEMKYLTWKTIFLTLLASGSRRGEVHSFDYKKVRPGSKWSCVTLEPHASFVSKIELMRSGASVFSAVKIPGLGPVLGPGLEEDLGLCPVRALKVYLDRTQELREDRQLLFISYKSGHTGDIHKNTISSWIRKLLHFAYSSAPEDVISLSSARTHEVRALASSMAFRGNMDLEEVLKACTWKSANTFTTHYLRDVSTFAEELHSLGPVVAAQSVVRPH